LLLLSEPNEIAEILPNGPLTRYTERTIVEIEDLIKHLQSSRKVGYTLDDREAEIEGVCVASPIIGSQKQVLAAIGVSATIYQLPPHRMHEAGDYLRKVGEEISRQLGFSGTYPGSPGISA
jgi:IclR family acetate operon transcriptional repressor